MTDVHRETEVKFRVTDSFRLPDVTALGYRIEPQPAIDLVADYYDTPATTLLRWGITLRRRVGGSDAGWHAKLPVSGVANTRDELQIAHTDDTVPSELIQILAPLLRGQDLVHRATVTTHRTPYLVAAATLPDDEALVELVDDQVEVSAEPSTTRFREIEIEVVSDSHPAHDALRAIGAMLVAQGAQPSSVSKAAAALGPAAALPPDVAEFPAVGPEGLAVDALRALLAKHIRHLLMSDVAVRRDLPDSVHQMRVAARRLRSTFSTYRPLLDAAVVTPVREDLAWLARELGAVRDTEVIFELLIDLSEELADERDRSAARAAIEAWFDRRMPPARASVLAALRTDRHDQVIEDLIGFVVDPPVGDEAFRPVVEVLLPRVRRVWRRLRAQVAELDMSGPDEQWHEVRIVAKKARYAAEGLAPVMGQAMARCAQQLGKVTDLLGVHQDAHVARATLRTLVDMASPTEAFALGMMSQHEADRQRDFRREFAQVWPDVTKAAHRAGLE